VARAALGALAAAALAACGDPDAGAPSAQSPASSRPVPALDSWLGQWNGPEGTYLRISRAPYGYEVVIQDLDGPRVFAGLVVQDGILIDRDGRDELIHATDGPGTGMKWLADKHDCLAVRPNEGYCRD
jgi:hypothetical protein